jgi:hypothetical protein
MAGLLSIAASGCPAAGGDDEPGPGTGLRHEDHACFAAWGELREGVANLYVDSEADASVEDGSVDAPFVALEPALELARGDAGPTAVYLAAGSWSPPESRGRFALSGAEGGDDTAVRGCGADLSTLLAIEAVPPGGESDPEHQPAFEVLDGAQGVTLSGVTLSGGLRALLVTGGSGSERPIRVESVAVLDSFGAGVAIGGLDTVVEVEDLRIDSVVAEDLDFAVGFAAQAGGSVWDPPQGSVSWTGGDVTGVEGIGIFLDHVNASVENVAVHDTVAMGGPLGRGLHAQYGGEVVLESLSIERTYDSALFLHENRSVTVRNSSFRDTQGESLPAFPDAFSGDGLAMGHDEDQPDAADWTLVLEGNTFEDNFRAGALVEDGSVVIDAANVFLGNGLMTDGKSFPNAPDIDTLVVQGGSVVSGPDGSAAPLAVVEVGGDSGFDALGMATDPLSLSIATE